MQLGSEGCQDYSRPDLVPLTAVELHCPFQNVLTLMCEMYFGWVHASSHSSLTNSMVIRSLLLLLLLEAELKVVCCSCSSRLQMVM